MLHIMGNEEGKFPAEGGYLAINQEIANVCIRLEYKWGVKRHAPRYAPKRDNGLLYGPTCRRSAGCRNRAGRRRCTRRRCRLRSGRGARCDAARGTDHRLLHQGWQLELLDQWNTIEVIWQGDRAAHIVNGRTVNLATRLQQPDPQNPGQFIPLTRGKIAIEIEYAEIWFRRIEVKAI